MGISHCFKVLVQRLHALYYKCHMGKFGWHSVIISPLKINGPKNIIVGDNVTIEYKTWIASIPHTGMGCSSLVIEDGCRIGHFNHIYATHSVILHKNVLTADKVYISDNYHGYEDIDIPVHQQPIVQNGEVEIGEGSWLGENVCVLGVKIGKHCVIGANSVVTKDIPDYCVAVGSPAKIIKRYDFDSNSWKKSDTSEGTSMAEGGGKFTYLICAA